MTATEARTDRSRTAPPAREWSEFLFVPDLLFAVATLLAVWLLEPEPSLAMISLIACLFAATAALRRGGPYLLPSSVFFLASGVFVGVAAFYLGRVDHDVDPLDVRNAAALALLSTIGIAIVVLFCSVQWKLRWQEQRRDGDGTSAGGFRPPRQFVLRGVVLVVASQLPPVRELLGPIGEAIGLTGILMLALVGSTRRVRMRWFGDVVLVAVAVLAPLFWFYVEFSGGGRLVIAGLLVASFMGWNLVRPHRAQKLAVILAIPFFLFFAGMDRLDRGNGTEGVSTSTVVADGKGLGSLYAPLMVFGEIIEPKAPEQMDRLGPRYGGTFFNTLVLPVPRMIWDDKPVGFGRELVVALEMRGVSEDHSTAGMIHGEWYANFGYSGLVLMVPTMGVVLAWLDRVHSRLVRDRMSTSADWWSAVVLMCVVASLADLYWVGTFTWFARGGLAAIVAAVLARISVRRVRLARRIRRMQQPGGHPVAAGAGIGGAKPEGPS